MSENKEKNEGPENTRKGPLLPMVIPKDPAKELEKYKTRAVELRYAGRTFKQIRTDLAFELQHVVHEDTIRKWFARGGDLHETYLEYAREENDHRRQLMREELKKLVVKIPTKLEAILDRIDQTGKPDMVSLMAIKTIVEILGITANDERQSQDVLGEYFKKLEKIRVERRSGTVAKTVQ